MINLVRKLTRLGASPQKRTELFVFACLALAHLGYVFFVSTPLIHADEAGHLLKAAALVGHTTHGPTPYGVGFPILISPLFMIFDDPSIIFRFVLLVNAVLSIVTAWLVYRFLVVWTGDGRNWRMALLASSAAALYPASFAYTTSAQAEVLFSSMFAGLLLSNFHLAKSDGKDWWTLVLSAGLAGAIVIVHLRGAPTAILSALFVLFILSRARRFGALAVWFVIAAGILIGGRWIAQTVDGRLNFVSFSDVSEFSSSSYKVLSKLEMFSSYDDFVARFSWLVVTGLGQLSYLIVASFGLIVIGAMAVARRARISASIPTRTFYIFVLILLAANLAMSAFSLSHGTRIDHLIYGRYNEAVLPLFLAIGLLEINRSNIRITLTAFVASMIILVSILTTILGSDFSQANLHNVMSLLWVVVPLERFGAFGLILVGCIAAAIYVAVYFLYVSFYRRLPIILLVCVIFAMQSVLLAAFFLKPSSDGRMAQRRIAEYVQAHVKPGTCITQHLTAEASLWVHWNTKFFLLNYPIREEVKIDPDQICGQWVISGDPDFRTRHPDAVMVLREHNHAQRLWYVGQDPESVKFANELIPGEHINLDGNAHGLDFLTSGWGALENWGIWLVGRKGSIEMRIPQGSKKGVCRFRLRGVWLLNERRRQGNVAVRVGRGPAQAFKGRLPTIQFDWPLTIHSDNIQERRVAIDIRPENPQTMQELGLSNDRRPLSIGLKSLIFEGCGT